VEDIQHVFFKCDVIVQVWSYIFKWMGVNFLVFTSVLDHFYHLVVLSKERILRGFDILFGLQQLGVFGVLGITFFLDEIMLMLIP
jgi:hypothetical protein